MARRGVSFAVDAAALGALERSGAGSMLFLVSADRTFGGFHGDGLGGLGLDAGRGLGRSADGGGGGRGRGRWDRLGVEHLDAELLGALRALDPLALVLLGHPAGETARWARDIHRGAALVVGGGAG